MYFPKISGKSSNQFIESLDGVAISQTPFSTPAYALAAALLWRSADDAMTELVNCSTEEAPPVKPKKSYGKEFWASGNIMDVYVKNKGVSRKTAAELGANEKYVLSQLKRNGFPCLGRKNINCEISAIQAFRHGESLSESCVKFGADMKHVENMLRIGISQFSKALDLMK